MKVANFLAGTLGMIGLGVSLLAGLSADNPVSTILTRALWVSLSCYVAGYLLGAMMDVVLKEHAEAGRLAASKRREEAMAQDKAASGAAAGGTTPGSGASSGA